MKWHSVKNKLPRANSNILMAWKSERSILAGKFFGGRCTLSGFAVFRGTHYVGKMGVTHWAYIKDAINEIEGERK